MSCNGGGSGVTAVIMIPIMMGVNIMSGGGSTGGITYDVAVDRSSGSSNDGARGMLPAAVPDGKNGTVRRHRQALNGQIHEVMLASSVVSTLQLPFMPRLGLYQLFACVLHHFSIFVEH